MINDQIIDAILKILECRLNLTELQKDIIDSIKVMKKNPSDRNALITRITENKSKYGIMLLKAFAMLSIQSKDLPLYKSYNDFSTDELQNYLLTQIKILFANS